MAFVKLDTGILNSTLWVERDCREIFITALLMAHPIELLEDMPQYAVTSLDKTGFVVPAGWYGFVEAAGTGIVRRALCDMDSGMAALARLGSPDPESRTPDHEGRRLVRVNGGYIVLNFIKYREKDATTKERSARYRLRQKAKESQCDDDTSRRDSHTASHGVTRNHQAEAEAEVKKDISHPSGAHPPEGGKAARFVEFWTAWPAGERKQDKAKCLKHWRLHGLDAAADAVLADVRAKRGTHKWAEGFIEAPLVYLRGKRWEDGGSEGPAAVLEVIDNRRAETERLLSEQKAHPATKPPQAVRDLLKSKGVAA